MAKPRLLSLVASIVWLSFIPASHAAGGGGGVPLPPPPPPLQNAGPSRIPLVCIPAPTTAQCTSQVYGQTCGLQHAAECAPVCQAAEASLTAAKCEDRAWLDSVCGQIERPKWMTAVSNATSAPGKVGVPAALGTSRCATLKATINAADGDGHVTMNAPRINPTEILRPTSTFVGNAASGYPIFSRDQGRVYTLPNKKVTMQGAGSGYRALRTEESMTRTGAVSNVEVALINALKANYETNGLQVDSCREYVYEKYYNFSKLEDAVASKGNSAKAWWDKAFVQPNPYARDPQVQVIPNYAIGSLALAGNPVKSKDGAVLPKQPTIKGPEYKNIFFALAPLSATPRQQSPTRDVVATRDDVASQDIDVMVTPVLGLPNMTPVPGLCGGLMHHIRLCDKALEAKILEGSKIKVKRDWGYYKNIFNTAHLTTVPDDWGNPRVLIDEDLERAEEIKKEYIDLLAQRETVVGGLAAYFGRFPPAGIDVDNIVPTDYVASRSLLGLATASSFDAAGPAATAAPLPLPPGGVPLTIPLAAFAPTGHDLVVNKRLNTTELLGVVNTGANLVDFNDVPALLAYITDLRVQLLFIDGRIEALLHKLPPQYLATYAAATFPSAPYTDVLGNPLAFSPADASYSDFAQQLVDFYAPEQEADYKRCQGKTSTLAANLNDANRVDGNSVGLRGRHLTFAIGDGVLHVPTTNMGTSLCALDAQGKLRPSNAPHAVLGDVADDPNSPFTTMNIWNRDTTHMDAYFVCSDSFDRMVLQLLASLLSGGESTDVKSLMDENGDIRLADSAAEFEKEGTDDWNVYRDYGFGWAIEGADAYTDDADNADSPDAFCMLQPQGWAYVALGATAFGDSSDVVRVSADLRVKEGVVPIPGQVVPNKVHVEIFGSEIYDDVTSDGLFFNETSGGGENDNDSDTIVSISVPFAAGPVPMEFEAGIAAVTGTSYSLHAGPGPTNCLNQVLQASVTPFAGVEGFASVSVNAVVVEAGIKISITLIKISLPFITDVGFQDIGNGTELVLNTTLDLVLETLGGRMEVFLRILWESWYWKIFGWTGFRTEVPLFHGGMQFKVEPVLNALTAYKAQHP